jgi:hypothetical protein
MMRAGRRSLPSVLTSYVRPKSIMVYSVCPNNEIKSNHRNCFAVSCILAIVSSSVPKSKYSIAPQVLSQTRDLSTLRLAVGLALGIGIYDSA